MICYELNMSMNIFVTVQVWKDCLTFTELLGLEGELYVCSRSAPFGGHFGKKMPYLKTPSSFSYISHPPLYFPPPLSSHSLFNFLPLSVILFLPVPLSPSSVPTSAPSPSGLGGATPSSSPRRAAVSERGSPPEHREAQTAVGTRAADTPLWTGGRGQSHAGWGV